MGVASHHLCHIRSPRFCPHVPAERCGVQDVQSLEVTLESVHQAPHPYRVPVMPNLHSSVSLHYHATLYHTYALACLLHF